MYTGKAFAVALVTSFVVSVVICSAFLLVIPRFVGFPSSGPIEEKVEVPAVTNAPVDEARLILQNKGLLMMEAEEKKDPNVLVGWIVSQDPLPGFKVEKGAVVKVIVSAGGEEVVIPNLEGIPKAQARLQLESIKLVVGTISRKAHASIPKDAVVSTDPPAGTKAPAGTMVNLVLSSGESLVTVPGVFKMSPGRARSRLEAAGLKVQTRYTTNIDYEFEIVIGQNPKAGKKVRKGSTVTITVNAEAR
ncbi:MAG: PASTA domain-containing protein [bacterium]